MAVGRSISRPDGACLEAEKLVCGYVKQLGYARYHGNVGAGYVVLPLAYRLGGYAEMLRYLLLGHARGLAQRHYALAQSIGIVGFGVVAHIFLLLLFVHFFYTGIMP